MGSSREEKTTDGQKSAALCPRECIFKRCGSGSGSGCCQRSPPPPVVSCGSGCQQGYQCGPYGCSRRKALSALTARIDGVIVGDDYGEEAYTVPLAGKPSNIVSNFTSDKLTNPNNIFHMCCEARGLPDVCLRLCHFNHYTANSLERMFHKEDGCPIEAAHEIHYCAAQGLDHTECCQQNGVGNTVAGEKCLTFCDQRPNRFTSLDVSYLPCYDVFENMKRCFFVEIRRKAEQKFSSSVKTSSRQLHSDDIQKEF
ncbi:DB module [Dictyocaulus viviparus]|uniref:DB module n=1 Tax=Dictyocaulus viviparus TaxID=29172 RepID=A0A0D8XG18_DICVI|nr:DB module [Dictyocaulus viviparus]